MPLSREIEKLAKGNIYDNIYEIIERYINEGLSIYDIERYFKTSKSFNSLLNDINYNSRKYFESGDEYSNFVKNVLNMDILDKKSEIETLEMTESKIIKFNDYLNESVIVPNEDLTIEYLFNNMEYSKEDMDILASYFNTKKEYIESDNPQYCVYSVTDFKADVLNNNRIRFNVLLLADFQTEKMRSNIINKVISGVFEKIPEDVDYMGIRIKPHTLMDKERLRDSISKLVSVQEVLNLLTNMTKYNFIEKYGNYYIWKKEK